LNCFHSHPSTYLNCNTYKAVACHSHERKSERGREGSYYGCDSKVKGIEGGGNSNDSSKFLQLMLSKFLLPASYFLLLTSYFLPRLELLYVFFSCSKSYPCSSLFSLFLLFSTPLFSIFLATLVPLTHFLFYPILFLFSKLPETCPAPGFWALFSDTLLLSIYSDLVPSCFSALLAHPGLFSVTPFLFLASVVPFLYTLLFVQSPILGSCSLFFDSILSSSLLCF
jgi:hypothetical protein